MKKEILILLILKFIIHISYAQCNGSLSLCSKKYNEVAYLTTHNAFNSDEDGLLFPNQTHNITSQLNDGVRGLMIDVYNYFGVSTSYHSLFTLGTIPLSDIFNDIKIFLDNNPNEIITIILECHVTANDIEYEINQSGLSNYLYTHNVVWPTLQNMVDNNNRLVVFTDRDDASGSQDWYHYIWDYAVETHYSVNTINDFTCNFNRGNPLNDLFIFNHFVTNAILGYGLYSESTYVNANPFFISRALDCQVQTNKFPNFLTVDYYELGDGLSVVDELNGITEFGCTDSLACNYDVLADFDDNSCMYLDISILSTNVSCYGYSDGSIIATTTGGAMPLQYSLGSGASQAIGSFSNLSKGIYYINIEDINGCTAKQSVAITEPELLESFDTLNTNHAVLWNSTNLEISGNYSDTLTNANGCDSIAHLNLNVILTEILDITNKRDLIKITNVLGQETPCRKNSLFFHIYDDGTIEKKIMLE